MGQQKAKTKKGAASIYIVIFTTTLLGIIALSFVRIMLAESLRTTNYSLSQSAYNSALAGIEDAKIILLRNQSCVNKGSFISAGGMSGCSGYTNLFGSSKAAAKTAKDCSIVGKLLHPSADNSTETKIQTQDGVDTGTVDQAYTCVKIAAYTEDFLAVLKDDNPTKIIPLRTEDQSEHDAINRVQIQWFDDDNYQEVSNNSGILKDTFTGFNKSGSNNDLIGKLSTNVGSYTAGDDKLANKFTTKPLVPPALQVTMIQSAKSYTISDFYTTDTAKDGGAYRTNRGTLLLRPTTKDSGLGVTASNHSNILGINALAYSANKSYNTPIDVKCNPNAGWSYACSADIFIPKPKRGGSRNMTSSFLVVNLPYNTPTTDIAVKMYHCEDPSKPVGAKIDTNKLNCRTIYFANVQPMVDSTGRANDLFRRVEARIELADTNFPISNYALAMTDPENTAGIEKDFFITRGCNYSSSAPNADKTSVVVGGGVCPNFGKNGSSATGGGKGNGESD